MGEWLRYAVRLTAAVILLGVAAVLLLMAATIPESRGLMLGVGGTLAAGGLFSWPRRPNAWRSEPPTSRQLAYAADLGVRVPRGATKGQVSDLISAAKER